MPMGIHENESSNTILDFKIGDLSDNIEVTSVDKSLTKFLLQMLKL